MTISEEQQVTIEAQGVHPAGGSSLMDDSWIGKTVRPQIMDFTSALPLHVCCCYLSLV